MSAKRQANIKGFTLVELAIAIVILTVIMTAVSSVYAVALKNYQTQSQRSFFQKELNFASDQINRDIKQAVEVPATYDTFTLGPTAIILGLPASDSTGNFIYNANILQKDYVVYYLLGTDLHKKIYATGLSSRAGQNGSDIVILSDVTAMSANYMPGGIPRQVATSLTLAKTVTGRNVSVTATQTVDLRNSP